MQSRSVDFSLADFLTTFNLFYLSLEYFSPFVLRSENLVDLENLKIRKITQKQSHSHYFERVELCAKDCGDITINFTRIDGDDRDNYSLSYSAGTSDTKNTVTLSSPKMPTKVLQKVLLKFIKMGSNPLYEKRVHHDKIVPKAIFQDLYFSLKQKYKHWIHDWNPSQDPLKDVFEEIGIATFLIILMQESKLDKELDFVDLGCGNGFLTFILVQEGFRGYGYDLQEREIWKKSTSAHKYDKLTILRYPNHSSYLQTKTITPSSSFSASWIIGNHSDELSPWIPILARQTSSCFFLLPCCMFNPDGSRWSGGGTEGRYRNYCSYIQSLSESLGFNVEREALRIPSTKNICLVGREYAEVKGLEEILNSYREMHVKIRKTDQEKTREWFERSERKKLSAVLDDDADNDSSIPVLELLDFDLELFD